MNVKVEVELIQLPSEHEEQQMYEAAEALTDDPGSIVIIPFGKRTFCHYCGIYHSQSATS